LVFIGKIAHPNYRVFQQYLQFAAPHYSVFSVSYIGENRRSELIFKQRESADTVEKLGYLDAENFR
jgi:hypothetical protein